MTLRQLVIDMAYPILYDDSLFDGQYIYSLFDYEKIVEIIERTGAFND